MKLEQIQKRKDMFIDIKVVDACKIPWNILEPAVEAQYGFVPEDYCYWYTSWRNSEGGFQHCSNSPEHTALSHYLIENGCEPNEKVILSF